MILVRVPPTLNIGGVDNEVLFRRGLMALSNHQGRSGDASARLEIDPSLKPTQQAEVFLHELIHRGGDVLGWNSGKSPVLDEAHVVALGHYFAAVFRELDVEFDFSAIPIQD